MLLELLNENRITITGEELGFEDAVRAVARPMLDDGSIEPRYIDAMISSVYETGPYIVLADRFAMPHARPTDGVVRLDMSLLLCKKAVDVLGNPVNLFIALAAADNNSHIVAMSELAGLLVREGAIDEICALCCCEEISEYLKKNIGDTQ